MPVVAADALAVAADVALPPVDAAAEAARLIGAATVDAAADAACPPACAASPEPSG